MFRRFMLQAVLLLPFLLGMSIGVTAQDATPTTAGGEVTILAPDEPYAGRTLAEWNAQQWQWIVSFPVDVNPGTDVSGERCGYGQSGAVFLVPGNFSPEPKTVTCIVPQGMAIFLGLGGAECSSVEPPPFFGSNEQELAACAAVATDAIVEIGARINGEEVPDVMSYRNVSPMFTMSFPEDNLFGVPAGTALAVSDSYNIMIAPPPPGEYEIEVTTRFEGMEEPFVGTMRFIVQEPQILVPEASPAATPMASPEG